MKRASTWIWPLFTGHRIYFVTYDRYITSFNSTDLSKIIAIKRHWIKQDDFAILKGLETWPRFHKTSKTSLHRLTGLRKDVFMFYETRALTGA